MPLGSGRTSTSLPPGQITVTTASRGTFSIVIGSPAKIYPNLPIFAAKKKKAAGDG